MKSSDTLPVTCTASKREEVLPSLAESISSLAGAGHDLEASDQAVAEKARASAQIQSDQLESPLKRVNDKLQEL